MGHGHEVVGRELVRVRQVGAPGRERTAPEHVHRVVQAAQGPVQALGRPALGLRVGLAARGHGLGPQQGDLALGARQVEAVPHAGGERRHGRLRQAQAVVGAVVATEGVVLFDLAKRGLVQAARGQRLGREQDHAVVGQVVGEVPRPKARAVAVVHVEQHLDGAVRGRTRPPCRCSRWRRWWGGRCR